MVGYPYAGLGTLSHIAPFLLLVTVTKILHSRNTGVETWITSDGRAYFVQLQETSLSEASTSEQGFTDDDTHVNWCCFFKIFDSIIISRMVYPTHDQGHLWSPLHHNIIKAGTVHAFTTSRHQSGSKNNEKSIREGSRKPRYTMIPEDL
jgi:hypothetical protein